MISCLSVTLVSDDIFLNIFYAEDSYYILTLRITSENFSEDLKDPISSRFKALKENVTREVSNSIIRTLGWK